MQRGAALMHSRSPAMQRGAGDMQRRAAPMQCKPADDLARIKDAAARCACVAAGFFLVTPEQLFSTTRGNPAEAFARQVWMAGLVTELGLTSKQVGDAIGRDPATVDHACRIIEALRGGMDAFDLADILGSDGVQEFLGGLDRVEAFIESAESLIDELFAAFRLVAVRGAAYSREMERLKEIAREQSR